MSPTLRISIATLLCTAGFAQAADPPSAEGIDLGSMKLKRATAPTAATPAPTGNPPPGLKAANSVQRQPANTQAAVATPQPVAAAQQPAQAAPPTPAANQTGVGTVVSTAPIGRRTAADILNQQPATANAQQSSGDVQVKLPSMFKKVNP